MGLEPLQDQWEELVDKWAAGGFQSLNKPEKAWFCVQSLICAVQDGGLISYYYNAGADNLTCTIKVLKELGADEIIECIEQVNSLFPPGTDLEDFDARAEAMEAWPDDDAFDERLDAIDERLMPLMEDLEETLAKYLAEQGYN